MSSDLLRNWELWFSCFEGAKFLMKVKIHRANGASSWQNPDAQKPLVGYLGSLTFKISPDTNPYHQDNLTLSLSCGHIAEHWSESEQL